MPELNWSLIQALAWIKIIAGLSLAMWLFLIYKKPRPMYLGASIGLGLASFYAVMSKPLAKMFWGNNGDEIFILTFLAKVISGQPFHDFFYNWLPPFYPPLYFWLAGLAGKLLGLTAVGAAKLGVIAVLISWFLVLGIGLKIYWIKIREAEWGETWMWLGYAAVFLIMIDFNDLLIKPYEALSALLGVAWIALLNKTLSDGHWTKRHYAFFGIAGGLLILTYYFWWLIFISALIVLLRFQSRPFVALKRLLVLGVIVVVVSSIYFGPLFFSWWQYGSENWQARFFHWSHLVSVLPWQILSWTGLLWLMGWLLAWRYRTVPVVRTALVVALGSYLYYFANLFLLVGRGLSFQAQKPFPLLPAAALALAIGYGAVELWHHKIANWSPKRRQLLVLAVVLLYWSLLPWHGFIDNKEVLTQLGKDMVVPTAKDLAEKIKVAVPNYEQRTWLSSNLPELGAYLPLSYMVAYNPHFSHQAVKYSDRLASLKLAVNAKTPEDFLKELDKIKIGQADALLLYKSGDQKNYPLFFWQDSFPNGGRELIVNLPSNLIDEKNWQKIEINSELVVFIKK